jgi:hypothetical protein
MRMSLAAFAGLSRVAAPSAGAQTVPAPPASPPCSAPEYRQLDFWVGEWDLEFDQAPGQPMGRARNTIRKDEYDGCAIVERFVQPGGAAGGGDYLGTSYSSWDPQIGKWRQMWVDNGGATFVLTGGPVQGADHVFELVTTEPRGASGATVRRMIWQDVSADALVWRWQSRQPDGSWQDTWVLRYKRRK